MFSRAHHRLHIFPRLLVATAYDTAYRLHVFPRSPPVACFPALVTGYFNASPQSTVVQVRDWFVALLIFATAVIGLYAG